MRHGAAPSESKARESRNVSLRSIASNKKAWTLIANLRTGLHEEEAILLGVGARLVVLNDPAHATHKLDVDKNTAAMKDFLRE